ncbi:MAG: hypothetical protein HYS41_06135 [Candidatus Omnitrophica bacterium]|nr:hypothetical protein [Candidatus Omnitrophota bacterium]
MSVLTEPVLSWLSRQGIADGSFEPRGDLLILRLGQASRRRIFSEPVLRKELVAQAQALGFSRLCLELPSE